MNERLLHLLKRFRFVLFFVVMAAVVALSFGVTRIQFATDYKIYFPKGEPTVNQLDALHAQFGRTNTLLFVVKNPGGSVFNAQTLGELHDLTERAWKIPHAHRVDSITNYQAIKAQGDTVNIGAVVRSRADHTPAPVAELQRQGRTEPDLVKRLVSSDGSTAGVLLTLRSPPEAYTAAMETTAGGDKLLKEFREKNPKLQAHMTGLAAVEVAYAEASQSDLMTLTPLMYLIILVAAVVMLRSLGALLVLLVAITAATAATLGTSGWLGYEATTMTGLLPTVVLATSVAEVMHMLSAARQLTGKYATRLDVAMAAIGRTFRPIAIGSVVNAIGFYSLVFAASPPYREFGLMAAIGCIIAFIVTLVVAAALIPFLKLRPAEERELRRYDSYLGLLLKHPKTWLMAFLLLSGVAAVVAGKNEINDRIVENFSTSMPVRQATEFAMDNLSGVYQIEYIARSPKNDISDPAFLRETERFVAWLREQPEVNSVVSLNDAIKRLHKAMHADEASAYRLPVDPNLAAQMLLVYEMSLPFGMDLGDQVTIDKAATRLAVTLGRLDTKQIRAFKARADEWWSTHADRSAVLPSVGSGETAVFAELTHISIAYMVNGLLFALLSITACVALFLRSIPLGLLSIPPNVFPFTVLFGLWALVSGEINTAAANVCVVVYGLIVDATIHITNQYREQRTVLGHDRETSLRLTYRHVLPSVFANSVILTLGFLVLTASPFSMNADFGLLAAIAIMVGFAFDVLCLPLLLYVCDPLISRSSRPVLAAPVVPAQS